MDFYLLSGLNKLIVLGVCCGGIAISLTADSAPCQGTYCQVQQGANQLSLEQLENEIQSITVQITSENKSLGSGVLIQKKDNIYTVITNAHVLRLSKSPYYVKTPDGEKYTTELMTKINLGQNDLGLLEFKSKNDKNYAIAKIGKSSETKEGDKVFVGGFPSKIDKSLSKNGLQGFVIKYGRVALVLNKPLEQGYQIGYTNEIRKGMSGGGVLNRKAELIGINGLHHEPLWDAPDFYQDGSTPCAPLQAIITKSSWSIPIDIVIKLLPQSWNVKPVSVSKNLHYAPNIIVATTNLKEEQHFKTLKEQAEMAKKCQNNPVQNNPAQNLKK